MRGQRFSLLGVAVIAALSLMVSGCAVNFYKQSPRSKERIVELEAKIGDLEAQRAREHQSFEEAKRMLEQRLRGRIADESVSLEMDERGLVIILSDDILFDSGKAEVNEEGYGILEEVAAILNKKIPGKDIGISGHTDNVPIKHSQWKSNWELSTARATNVLHYLVERGISPEKLSATGYGEHRPITSNATVEGRAKNRRVEIAILPEFEKKRQEGISEARGAEQEFVK